MNNKSVETLKSNIMFEKIDNQLRELKNKLNSKNIDDKLEYEIENLKNKADDELERLMNKINPKNEREWENLGDRINDFSNLPKPKNSWEEFEKENLGLMFPDEDDYEGYNWTMD